MNYGLIILILTAFFSIAGSFLELWGENPNETEQNKFKRKLFIKIITSVFVLVGFYFGYRSFIDDQAEKESTHKMLDSSLTAQILAGNKPSDIKDKAETTLQSLNLMDTSIKRNNKTAEIYFTNLLNQNQRLQYPIQSNIKADILIEWHIKKFENEIKDFIFLNKKKPVSEDYPYTFLIDSTYEIYNILFLSFKELELTFKTTKGQVQYEAIIYPKYIPSEFEELYYKYETNIFYDSYFSYDSLSDKFMLKIGCCNLKKAPATADIISILDINNSTVRVLFNPTISEIQNKLSNVKQPYISNYVNYKQLNPLLYININFNGIFHSSYSSIPFAVGCFSIPKFRLGKVISKYDSGLPCN